MDARRTRYEIEFKPRALKDLDAIPDKDKRRIIGKIEKLQDNLAGDVKKLTNYSPEYRLRVGNFRVLFAIEHRKVVVYRVLDRKDAYS